ARDRNPHDRRRASNQRMVVATTPVETTTTTMSRSSVTTTTTETRDGVVISTTTTTVMSSEKQNLCPAVSEEDKALCSGMEPRLLSAIGVRVMGVLSQSPCLSYFMAPTPIRTASDYTTTP
ncbi:hypothetical protein FOZ62_018802, partial [Perkinsus olseni]